MIKRHELLLDSHALSPVRQSRESANRGEACADLSSLVSAAYVSMRCTGRVRPVPARVEAPTSTWNAYNLDVITHLKSQIRSKNEHGAQRRFAVCSGAPVGRSRSCPVKRVIILTMELAENSHDTRWTMRKMLTKNFEFRASGTAKTNCLKARLFVLLCAKRKIRWKSIKETEI